jgi:hypothetical protein
MPYLLLGDVNTKGDILVIQGVRLYGDPDCTASPPTPPTPTQAAALATAAATLSAAPDGAEADCGGCLGSVICKLAPEGAPRRPWMLGARAASGSIDAERLSYLDLSFARPLTWVLNGRYTALKGAGGGDDGGGGGGAGSGESRPASTSQPTVIMGDPLGLTVLDVRSNAAAVHIWGPTGAFTARYVTLMGLPPAEAEAEAEAEGLNRGGGASGGVPAPAAAAPTSTPPAGEDAPQDEVVPSQSLTNQSVPTADALLHRPPLSPLWPPPSLSPSLSPSPTLSPQQPTPSPPAPPPPRKPMPPLSPMQGIATSLTNFTSCLWTFGFDRRAAKTASPDTCAQTPAGCTGAAPEPAAGGGGGGGDKGDPLSSVPPRPAGLPYVFLDSVVMVIPQRELDALVLTWTSWTSGSASSPTAAAVAAAAAAVTEDPDLAAELGAMITGSQLAAESVAAVSAAATAATAGSDGGTVGTAAPSQLLTAITFKAFSWCALQGRNVTLTSRAPASLELLAARAGALAPPSLLRDLDLPVRAARLLQQQQPQQPQPQPQPQQPQQRPQRSGPPHQQAPSISEALPDGHSGPTSEHTTADIPTEVAPLVPEQQGPPDLKALAPDGTPDAAPSPREGGGGGGGGLPVWGVAAVAFAATFVMALSAASAFWWVRQRWWRPRRRRRAGGGCVSGADASLPVTCWLCGDDDHDGFDGGDGGGGGVAVWFGSTANQQAEEHPAAAAAAARVAETATES